MPCPAGRGVSVLCPWSPATPCTLKGSCWLGCPGVSPCHRLGCCQHGQCTGGFAAQRARGAGWCWRVHCGNSLLFHCRQYALVPRCPQGGGEAEAGPGQGSGGGSFAAQNHGSKSSYLVDGWPHLLLTQHGGLAAAGETGPSFCPILSLVCAAG